MYSCTQGKCSIQRQSNIQQCDQMPSSFHLLPEGRRECNQLSSHRAHELARPPVRSSYVATWNKQDQSIAYTRNMMENGQTAIKNVMQYLYAVIHGMGSTDHPIVAAAANYIFARQLIAFSIPTRSIDDYNDDIGLLDQTTFSLFRNNSEIYCVLLLFICITQYQVLTRTSSSQQKFQLVCNVQTPAQKGRAGSELRVSFKYNNKSRDTQFQLSSALSPQPRRTGVIWF